MSAPRLDRRMVLEDKRRAADGSGGWTETWQPLGELWAELRPGLGRERRQEFAVISAVHYRVIVRGVPDGSPARPRAGQRLRMGGRLFAIVGVAEHDPGGRFLICFAYEETGT